MIYEIENTKAISGIPYNAHFVRVRGINEGIVSISYHTSRSSNSIPLHSFNASILTLEELQNMVGKDVTEDITMLNKGVNDGDAVRVKYRNEFFEDGQINKIHPTDTAVDVIFNQQTGVGFHEVLDVPITDFEFENGIRILNLDATNFKVIFTGEAEDEQNKALLTDMRTESRKPRNLHRIAEVQEPIDDREKEFKKLHTDNIEIHGWHNFLRKEVETQNWGKVPSEEELAKDANKKRRGKALHGDPNTQKSFKESIAGKPDVHTPVRVFFHKMKLNSGNTDGELISYVNYANAVGEVCRQTKTGVCVRVTTPKGKVDEFEVSPEDFEMITHDDGNGDGPVTMLSVDRRYRIQK